MMEYLGGRVTVHHGDSRDVLKTIPDCSIDSVVSDPPYALVSIGKRFGADDAAPAKAGVYARASAGFMGKRWDTGEVAFDPEFWVEVLRVLKPGGHVLAFGGTRTYHRLACAIEDAGFEIRDMTAWIYGSGFPKSHDVSKGLDKRAGVDREVIPTGNAVKRMIPGADQNKDGWEKTNGREYQPGTSKPVTPEAIEWEGWGTALKPALEPICLARKPLIGTVAENVMVHRTGALNIDGCRIETEDNLNGGAYAETTTTTGASNSMSGPLRNAIGRVPPGDERKGAALGMFQEGKTVGRDFVQPPGRWPANLIHDGSEEVIAAFPETDNAAVLRVTSETTIREDRTQYRTGPTEGTIRAFPDSGSAARFFKSIPLDDEDQEWSRLHYTAKADADDRIGSKHPTVKPVGLKQYLVRLITPPGGTVLDPFAGTGTTGEAAWREGMKAILIEREPEYQTDIARRMELAENPTKRAAVAKTKNNLQGAEGTPLFG